MESYEFQIVQLKEKLDEFITHAEEEAAKKYAEAVDNFEHRERVLKGEIAGLESNIDVLSRQLQETEQKFEALRSKLTALV